MNLNSINIRYKYAPQMKYYDKMKGGVAVPYALNSGPIEYDDNICIKTDLNGFRYSLFENKFISTININELKVINIIVGGSTVFGVGSSNNESTIASLLSKETKEPWINLGLRACNSIQEYIHLIQYTSKAKIKNIIFFSGINDIYINLISKKIRNFDPMFNAIAYKRTFYGCKKRFAAFIISKVLFKNYDSLLEYNSIRDIIFANQKNDEIEINESLIQIKEIFKRNFMLYKGLESSLKCNVKFILQPFIHWTKKRLSQEEKDILKYLEQRQGSVWRKQKNKMNFELYRKILNILNEESVKNNIEFIDSNQYFKKDDFLFVDSVHLNDNGNLEASNLIKGAII